MWSLAIEVTRVAVLTIHTIAGKFCVRLKKRLTELDDVIDSIESRDLTFALDGNRLSVFARP
jgi:hypothetical protein